MEKIAVAGVVGITPERVVLGWKPRHGSLPAR
jgi:hypothetical protein